MKPVLFVSCIFLSISMLASCSAKNYGDELFNLRRATFGKDVIWIPTQVEAAKAMLKAANVGPADIVYDLGSGDGVIPIQAAKHFAVRAVGIEYNPDLVALSNRNAKRAGVEHLVSFRQGDIFLEDYSEATVLTLYLGEALNIRLMPKILGMPAGTRVVSNTFRMEAWTPDQEIQLPSGGTAYLWIVPAIVEGSWTIYGFPDFEELNLSIRQKKQVFDGIVRFKNRSVAVLESGVIVGKSIKFNFLDSSNRKFSFFGDVVGSHIIGEFQELPGVRISIKSNSIRNRSPLTNN